MREPTTPADSTMVPVAARSDDPVANTFLDGVAGVARATSILYAAILRQLTPDEARILAALADGAARPVVDVVVRTALGGAQRVLLRNASSIGRHAGLSAPRLVPTYLTRLHRLAVVDIGEEDPALAEQYDILLTESLVKDAEVRARRARKGAPRFVRRTVVMSELGRGFWAACDPHIAGTQSPAD